MHFVPDKSFAGITVENHQQIFITCYANGSSRLRPNAHIDIWWHFIPSESPLISRLELSAPVDDRQSQAPPWYDNQRAMVFISEHTFSFVQNPKPIAKPI
jgi:hypothetical protein